MADAAARATGRVVRRARGRRTDTRARATTDAARDAATTTATTTTTSDAAVEAALRDAADAFLGRLLDAPLAERPALVAALRTADPALHALVASLLVHLDDVDGFLEEPLGIDALEDDTGHDDGAAFVGARFGHWQVRRTLGHGGMGLVFEVERVDGVVAQRAALKLIRRGLDDRSIVARFSAERQILAGLDHPSIARLIDAGADDGRPYLVMEYVDGVPLDRWCADRALSIDARIALFNQVCTAVHYAHQRLVVHRDLKPGNLLVTADGLPKLLDFGISKLVGADGASAASAETIDAATLLTPRYASPEQLTGAPISTVSDVYSLGVLLYELLTGALPYRTRNDSLVEMMRAVMTEEPTRPSQVVRAGAGARASHAARDPRLARRLRGDLDHILMKALARDPAERYESAAALRDDLVRHLAGDPVKATAPSWRYRAGKFVRRHRAAVAFTAAVAVAVASLGVVASYQALRAERARVAADAQRALAERRFDDTRSLAKAMLFDLDAAIATGPTTAREQLVRTAITYLDRLSQDRLSVDLQREVAAGYERIAEILGSDITGNLGRSSEARDYLLKARRQRERLVALYPDSQADLAGLVDCDQSLAKLAQRDAKVDEAAAYLDAAYDVAMRRVRLRPDDVGIALKVFPVRRLQAIVQYYPDRPSLGRYDEGYARLARLVDDVEAFGRAHPDVPRATLEPYLNSYLHDFAQVALQGGRLQAALAAARRSLALSEANASARPADPTGQRKLMLASDTAARVLLDVGAEREAMALFERSMGLRRRLAALDPDSATATFELDEGYQRMGAAYRALGRPRDALVQYEQWLRRAEEAMTHPAFPLHNRLDLAAARVAVAAMRMAVGDPARALDEARRAEREVLAFDGPAAASPMARAALGEARLVEAEAVARSGDPAAAFARAREGLASLAANADAMPADAYAARTLQRARIDAGTLVLGDRALRTAGCGLIETGRDALVALKAADRLAVGDFALIDRATRALARCGKRGSA